MTKKSVAAIGKAFKKDAKAVQEALQVTLPSYHPCSQGRAGGSAGALGGGP